MCEKKHPPSKKLGHFEFLYTFTYVSVTGVSQRLVLRISVWHYRLSMNCLLLWHLEPVDRQWFWLLDTTIHGRISPLTLYFSDNLVSNIRTYFLHMVIMPNQESALDLAMRRRANTWPDRANAEPRITIRGKCRLTVLRNYSAMHLNVGRDGENSPASRFIERQSRVTINWRFSTTMGNTRYIGASEYPGA